MKFTPRLRSRWLGLATALSVAGVTAFAAAAPASADAGTNGWYELCSTGTYASYATWPSRGGFSSFVASPGQCVPIYMDGTQTDIYGLYPGGSSFYIGSDWYQANIVTTGDMGPGDYHWYVTASLVDPQLGG